MEVPFAADNWVPFGPFLRWERLGGKMDRMAPPSMSHLMFVLGSLMYNRLPVSLSRDAAAFTSGAPLARFPLVGSVVAVAAAS